MSCTSRVCVDRWLGRCDLFSGQIDGHGMAWHRTRNRML